MLFTFKFATKEIQNPKKNVDVKRTAGMFFNFCPGFFHFGTPVNVIENKNGVVVRFFQQLVKIIHGWSVAMVAINVCQVDGWQMWMTAGSTSSKFPVND